MAADQKVDSSLVASTFGHISAVFDLELGHTSKWQCVDQDLQDLFFEG